eukprot:308466-Chlamydomonas_euryale.AAC.1
MGPIPTHKCMHACMYLQLSEGNRTRAPRSDCAPKPGWRASNACSDSINRYLMALHQPSGPVNVALCTIFRSLMDSMVIAKLHSANAPPS